LPKISLRTKERVFRGSIFEKGKRKGKDKGSESYGPRFKRLSEEDAEKVKSKWTLHSLADVKLVSAADNARAAMACLQEVRQRRERDDEPRDKKPAAPPVFRPRSTASKAGDASTTQESSASQRSSRDGALVMEACVAGARRKVVPAQKGPDRQDDRPPMAKRGRISIAADNDEEGGDCPVRPAAKRGKVTITAGHDDDL